MNVGYCVHFRELDSLGRIQRLEALEHNVHVCPPLSLMGNTCDYFLGNIKRNDYQRRVFLIILLEDAGSLE